MADAWEQPALLVSQVRIEQVSLVLGADFVLSFLEGENALFDGVRERIRGAALVIAFEGSSARSRRRPAGAPPRLSVGMPSATRRLARRL